MKAFPQLLSPFFGFFFFTVDVISVVASVDFLFVDTALFVVFPPPLAALGMGLVVFHPLITTSFQTLSGILLGSFATVVAWLGCGITFLLGHILTYVLRHHTTSRRDNIPPLPQASSSLGTPGCWGFLKNSSRSVSPE